MTHKPKYFMLISEDTNTLSDPHTFKRAILKLHPAEAQESK